MSRTFSLLLAAVACLALAGCSQSNDATAERAPAAVKDEHAPDQFNVTFDTSKGPVVVEMHRDWSPNGVDHFYTLVKTHFYDGSRFYRVLHDFVAQFGIAADPKTNAIWATTPIPDDRVHQSNVRGTLTYAATEMPNSRTTQLFFNLGNNSTLDSRGFAPIGKVVSGMDAVDALYNGYGETAPRGPGPDADKIAQQGNQYLQDHFPRLDYVKTVTIDGAPAEQKK
ncbi:MAG TPA: peptidylprolyl isomerase [Candidatus Limnocylindrales bacterium]|nr:peptidylprolyl isomerase [Candidatus Limnocylindrales bacterium]